MPRSLLLFYGAFSLIAFSCTTPAVTTTSASPADTAAPAKGCRSETISDVDGHPVYRIRGEREIYFSSGLSVDGDGSPRCYHPDDDKGLDYLYNAGYSGNWWALATDDGTSGGKPVIQSKTDPAPGYYVSMTSLIDTAYKRTDPRRYVNSESVPFFVLPPQVRRDGGVRLGDLAMVYNTWGDKITFAIFADVGPKDHIGEGSIALADSLGINSNPRHGGSWDGVFYLVFPGSGNGHPKTPAEIAAQGEALFEAWGGLDRLKHCLK